MIEYTNEQLEEFQRTMTKYDYRHFLRTGIILNTQESVETLNTTLNDDDSTFLNGKGEFQKIKGDNIDFLFELDNIDFDNGDEFIIDISASFNYSVGSMIAELDEGTLSGLTLSINTTEIATMELTDVVSTTSFTESVIIGDRVVIKVPAAQYSGNPTIIRGKITGIRQ